MKLYAIKVERKHPFHVAHNSTSSLKCKHNPYFNVFVTIYLEDALLIGNIFEIRMQYILEKSRYMEQKSLTNMLEKSFKKMWTKNAGIFLILFSNEKKSVRRCQIWLHILLGKES